MGLCLVAARKLNLWSGRRGKTRAPCRAPQTALKFFGSVPSLLRARPTIDVVRRSVVIFLETVNNAGSNPERRLWVAWDSAADF